MKPSVRTQLTRVLFPDHLSCIVCGKEIAPNRYGLCKDCKLDINENFCVRCGRHKVGIGDYCGECSEFSMHVDEARSSVNYVDSACELVRRLKYANSVYLAPVMAQFMLDTLLFTDWTADCLTFVPIHKSRFKTRGYNQAELLARNLAELVDIRCEKLLEKSRPTPNQARLNREQRLENLKGSFSAVGKPPDHVILIDDVMTTGSTGDECAKTLKKAGAKVVYLLTFASVPSRPELDKPTKDISTFKTK